MTQPIDPLQLRNFIKTKADAVDMQLLIDTVNERLFKTDMSAFEILNKEAPYELGRAIARLAEESRINLNERDKIADFLNQLHSGVTSLPVVQITCAYAPKKGFITLLNDWFFTNYRKAVIIDIIVDPEITGGTRINFNGKMADYSLKKIMDEMPMQN